MRAWCLPESSSVTFTAILCMWMLTRYAALMSESEGRSLRYLPIGQPDKAPVKLIVGSNTSGLSG